MKINEKTIKISIFSFSHNVFCSIYILILTHQQQTFEKIVGKGEIACYEQFLLLQQCFLPNQITVSPFVHIFDIVSLFGAEFEKLELAYQVKG